jgi:hypothetical protein
MTQTPRHSQPRLAMASLIWLAAAGYYTVSQREKKQKMNNAFVLSNQLAPNRLGR